MTYVEETNKAIKQYLDLFPKAWKNLLRDIVKGKYEIPENETSLQCHLFAESIFIMQDENFRTPYRIAAEDKEIMKGKKTDLTLGYFQEELLTFRTVAVIELKHKPNSKQILKDVKKLREYTKEHAIAGFFAMIGEASVYREVVDQKFKEWGIKPDDKFNNYKWSPIVNPDYQDHTFDTLIVELRATVNEN